MTGEPRGVSGEHLVAIHQPNFFPWLGWFDKVRRADVFILLDDAQFPKKGGTWTNRVKVLTADGGEQWMTAPIVRSYHGTRQVREIELDDTKDWRGKVASTLAAVYSQAPGYAEVGPIINELLDSQESLLSRFNVNAIQRLLDLLGIRETEVLPASQLGVAATSTERLIELTKAVGGTSYLAGGGADGYQNDDAFAAAGIGLRKQAFVPPTYRQGTPAPVLGLSVIDALMHCGVTGTANLLTRTPES